MWRRGKYLIDTEIKSTKSPDLHIKRAEVLATKDPFFLSLSKAKPFTRKVALQMTNSFRKELRFPNESEMNKTPVSLINIKIRDRKTYWF